MNAQFFMFAGLFLIILVSFIGITSNYVSSNSLVTPGPYIAAVIACMFMCFIILTIIFMAKSAGADELNDSANVLLQVQLADATTTRAFMERPNTYERNPLARPFTHSDAAAVGLAIGLNLLARRVFKHSPKVIKYLAVLDALAVGNNVRTISR